MNNQTKERPLSIIATVGRGGVIGNKGKLPWGRILKDAHHFRKVTLGHTVAMGRKTYESFAHMLDDRSVFVLSRRERSVLAHRLRGCVVAEDFSLILEQTKRTRVFVVGGGEIYEQALPYTSTIYLTRVNVTVHGDTFFKGVPSPGNNWRLIHIEGFYSKEVSAQCSFETYIRW